MPEYSGSCQCGAVRFRFETDQEITEGMACNCSRCQRVGSVLTFVPEAKFHLDAGQGETTEYLFNHHRIRHQFCPTCGIQTFSFSPAPDGTPTVAINLNTVDGIDPRALKVTVFDGAAR